MSTSERTPIDLHHLGNPHVIGVYLLHTDAGLALVDTGPTSCLDALQRGLAERDVRLEDLSHILLTHIHLDHAGAAGAIVAKNPNVTVHVSEIGAPHLAAPERLERSARRVFGEAYDALWGPMTPIPESRIRAIGDTGDGAGIRAFATPGHASHHLAWLDDRDGTLFTGDVAGVRIMPGNSIQPVAPPPDIDVAAWHDSIERMRGLDPDRLALIHFGIVDRSTERFAVAEHLDDLDQRLDEWVAWVREGIDDATFTDRVEQHMRQVGVPDDLVAKYEQTGPPPMSRAGIARWVDRQES